MASLPGGSGPDWLPMRHVAGGYGMRRSAALLAAILLAFATSVSSAQDDDPGSIGIRIGVDWNGDGLIRTRVLDRVPVDAPTREQPYTHWINHDQDDIDTGGETWPIARPDASTPIIDSERDLEDFARLRVEIDGLADLPEDTVLTLGWQDGGGAMNVFRSADHTCSRQYLLDEAMALGQLTGPFNNRIGVITGTSLQTTLGQLGAGDLDEGGFCFLFDVAESGSGELLATLSNGAGVIAQSAPVAIDLRHIKTMYQRITVDWPVEGSLPGNISTRIRRIRT